MLDNRSLRIKAAAFFTSFLIIRCVSPLGLTFLIIIWPTHCFCHLRRGRKACLIFKAHWKDSAFEIGCKLRFCSNQGPWNIDQFQLKTGFFFSFFVLLLLLFVFSSFPLDGFVPRHKRSSAHSGSPRERVLFVWEMVRARLGQGRAGVGHVCGWPLDAVGQTHTALAAAFTAGNQSTSFQKEGFLNPSLTNPSQLWFRAPGNSLLQLDATAACASDRGEV